MPGLCEEETHEKMNTLGTLHYLAHKVNHGIQLTEKDLDDYITTKCLFVVCSRPNRMHGSRGREDANRECPLTNAQCIELEAKTVRHVVESMKKMPCIFEEKK